MAEICRNRENRAHAVNGQWPDRGMRGKQLSILPGCVKLTKRKLAKGGAGMKKGNWCRRAALVLGGVMYALFAAFGWQAEHSLEDMCRDTWRWQQKNPNGYDDE